jgi:cell division protease FtsH
MTRENYTPQAEAFQGLVRPSVLGAEGDVAIVREQQRLRRLGRLGAVLLLPLAWLLWRGFTHQSLVWFPHVGGTMVRFVPVVILIAFLALILAVQFVGGGASPHTLYRPGDIDIGFDDVVGIDGVKIEVMKTLNLFLGYRRFRELGGIPRRGILFEGPPGTGKTYLAKAMAKEADVPFLYVSSSSFQSHFYGMTGRKIRSFFKVLRKYAVSEGGAIAFFDEFDALGAQRSGLGNSRGDGIAGVVNTLLTELQSFDQPRRGRRIARRVVVEPVNRLLPAKHQLRQKPLQPANVLVIAATNRADNLDPALLRPGRFDRSIHFGAPSRRSRTDIARYYLSRIARDATLDVEEAADRVAAMTPGYSPVAISHIVNTALPFALSHGRVGVTLADITEAKLEFETGEKDPSTTYTDTERHRVAVHESGHATVAYFLGEGRQLDVLSIVKRRDSLGMLAHSDAEERFTRTSDEYEVLMRIAMAGKAAEALWFDRVSSGPAGDLVTATKAAAHMVGLFGFGKSFVSMAADDESGPLSQGLVGKVLGDPDMRAEVDSLLKAAYAQAKAVLDEHRDVVEALADALVDRGELLGHEIIEVIESAAHASGKAVGNAALDVLLAGESSRS